MNTKAKSVNNTRVRRFRYNEIPLIVHRSCEEIGKLPHYQGVEIDPIRIRQLLEDSVDDESHFMVHLLVNDNGEPVGGVAGYCVTSILNFSKVCSDIFLFIDPQWRSLQNVMKLISSYKEWARRQGAIFADATHTGGYRSDAMDMLMLKSGFERIGMLYRHRLDR